MLLNMFHHVAIYSKNINQATMFYKKYFDFDIKKILYSENQINGVHLQQNNKEFVLEILEEEAKNICNSFHIGFHIENVEAFYNKYKDEIVFVRTPFLLGKECIAFLLDYDGYLIEINNNLI